MKKSSKRIVEAYLVACARLGDAAAREHLVERYQRRFLRHAYRLLGDAEQARDAVQDAWVEIVRDLSKLQDEQAFPAWAFRIVSRRCARRIAALQRNRKILSFASMAPDPVDRGARDCELAADSGPLRAALFDLSSEHSAAIALFYLEEMTVAEVAVALDIPVGTVKSRLMHARRKLRVALEGECHGQV
ncbi:MAG TPA: sigma-70 family RNA polymerase sigma factor [Kiloniellaceae bacterium]|nr:sigma-70 family RNA polymerase sigma factor [Kiloniellaceae bacterium]